MLVEDEGVEKASFSPVPRNVTDAVTVCHGNTQIEDKDCHVYLKRDQLDHAPTRCHYAPNHRCESDSTCVQ